VKLENPSHRVSIQRSDVGGVGGSGGSRPYLSSDLSAILASKSVRFEARRGVDDHVVTYAATVLYPLLLFILGNINTMVVVVYQVEPDISVDLASRSRGTLGHTRQTARARRDSPWHSM
jgi:hypothetical protein